MIIVLEPNIEFNSELHFIANKSKNLTVRCLYGFGEQAEYVYKVYNLSTICNISIVILVLKERSQSYVLLDLDASNLITHNKH